MKDVSTFGEDYSRFARAPHRSTFWVSDFDGCEWQCVGRFPVEHYATLLLNFMVSTDLSSLEQTHRKTRAALISISEEQSEAQ